MALSLSEEEATKDVSINRHYYNKVMWTHSIIAMFKRSILKSNQPNFPFTSLENLVVQEGITIK